MSRATFSVRRAWGLGGGVERDFHRWGTIAGSARATFLGLEGFALWRELERHSGILRDTSVEVGPNVTF